MPLAGAYGIPDIDMLGSAECLVAPSFQQAASLIVPGQSLVAWERYWRCADVGRWIASPHHARMAASRLRETLDALLIPPILPSCDPAAMRSVQETVNGAIQIAMTNATIANGAEARRRGDAQQAFTSGGN